MTGLEIKHIIDVAICSTDIICLTETHILPDQDIAHIHYYLKDFEFNRNDDADKFQSIAVFHRNIHVLDYSS